MVNLIYMANTDNKCKDLDVQDYFSAGGYENQRNSLEDLYSLQAKTQNMYFEKQGRKPFSEFTIGDVVDFLMVTNHAIIDELHEMMDAVGGIEDTPMVKDGVVVPGKQMNLTLSSDHRIIDGALGAEFMRTLKGYLKHPAGLCVN